MYSSVFISASSEVLRSQWHIELITFHTSSGYGVLLLTLQMTAYVTVVHICKYFVSVTYVSIGYFSCGILFPEWH